MADDPPQPAAKGDTPQPTVTKEEAKPKLADRVYVKMSTSMGDIYIELNQEKAPITVKNFLDYVDEGFYNGLTFHRVINNFMIQGGGYDLEMKEKPTKPGIKNEWQNGLKNRAYTLAMARLGGKPDSATSQFFINVVDNSRLDQPSDGAAYAVFGKVIKGMEVVDKIKMVKTKTAGMHQNVPETPVVITKVSRIDPGDAEVKDAVAAAKAKEAEEAQKAAEEAARKAEAYKGEFEKAKAFVKAQGGDPEKGTTSPTGLWYVRVKEGTGESPKPTDNVKVHYTGWLTDGTKFDSSVDRGSPATFRLSGVIKGWTEGVGRMKVGEKGFLIIPPELGYGERGSPPKIGPNAVLIFQVELLGINN